MFEICFKICVSIVKYIENIKLVKSFLIEYFLMRKRVILYFLLRLLKCFKEEKGKSLFVFVSFNFFNLICKQYYLCFLINKLSDFVNLILFQGNVFVNDELFEDLLKWFNCKCEM